jgi:hypothetical protein
MEEKHVCCKKVKDGAFMKKLILVVVFALSVNSFVSAFGFFMEGGLGYNADENVGLGFVTGSKGVYTGIGVGLVGKPGTFTWAFGVNIDFLLKPQITFVRGEEHYVVENMADNASLRIMPYLELSKGINKWLYAGFGLGYGYGSIYFGMRPLLYDSDYTSYRLSSESWTPTLFLRAYIVDACYVSLNYEVDIVTEGELKRVAGDPLADFVNIDGATDINGVHHRVRLVFGYLLGFD